MTAIYTEQEYQKFEKKMHERFPKIFANAYGGFDVGAGWWHIIEILCANIQSHIDWDQAQKQKHNPGQGCQQVVAAQIKEKFGELRFYYDGGDDTVRGMVRMAEAWANNTCQTCGAPGQLRVGGWVRTLCDHHEAEYQKRLK